MISRKSILAMFACGLLAVGLTACGDDGGGGSSDLSGSIRVDGSSTVFPFAQAAAELFNGDNPNVEISVGESGTSGGFEKFCAGEIDITTASRPIEPEEVDACKKGGVGYTEVQVANDGLSVTTNPGLEISCLTVDQLKQLWEKGSDGRQLQPARQGRGYRASRSPTQRSASTARARTPAPSTTSPR